MVYKDDYRSDVGLKTLEEGGVYVRKFKEYEYE